MCLNYGTRQLEMLPEILIKNFHTNVKCTSALGIIKGMLMNMATDCRRRARKSVEILKSNSFHSRNLDSIQQNALMTLSELKKMNCSLTKELKKFRSLFVADLFRLKVFSLAKKTFSEFTFFPVFSARAVCVCVCQLIYVPFGFTRTLWPIQIKNLLKG